MSLLKIQQELKAPKNQVNNFGKYKYRSCEDILQAVKPLLEKYNFILTMNDEIVEIGGRVYVKATVTLYYDSDASDNVKLSSISTTAYAREPAAKKGMDESQITGATSSYARKYALNGMFCIDDAKDADATNQHGVQKQESKSIVLMKLILEFFNGDTEKAKAVWFDYLSQYKVKDFNKLTDTQKTELEQQIRKDVK